MSKQNNMEELEFFNVKKGKIDFPSFDEKELQKISQFCEENNWSINHLFSLSKHLLFKRSIMEISRVKKINEDLYQGKDKPILEPIVKKHRKFSIEELKEATKLLYVVKPTNEKFTDDWYTDNHFGKQIVSAQEDFLKVLKRFLLQCNKKEEIMIVLNKLQLPIWPFYFKKERFLEKFSEKEPSEDFWEGSQSNYVFWTKGHGEIIRKEFDKMFSKFTDRLTSLE